MTPMSGAFSVEVSVDLSDPMGNNWATEKLVILNYMFENFTTLPKASSVYENLITKVLSTTISAYRMRRSLENGHSLQKSYKDYVVYKISCLPTKFCESLSIYLVPGNAVFLFLFDCVHCGEQ